MPKNLTDHNNQKIAFAAFSSLCTCDLKFVSDFQILWLQH